MSLVVSIDVVPADVPAEHAAAAVSACSGALPIGSCELASSLPESAQPQAVALVLWQGDFLQVSIRVSHGGAQWTARSLRFAEQDSITERWTTVGLTIATLAGETLEASREQPSATLPGTTDERGQDRPTTDGANQVAAKEPATASSAMPAPAVPRLRLPLPQRERRFRVTLAGLTGQGWEGGRAQLGGFLGLGIRVTGTPLLAHGFGSFGSATDVTASGRDLVSDWVTMGVGAGIAGILGRFDLEASALIELAYRRILVTYGGRDLSTHEWPLRFRAAAVFPARGRVGATAGAIVRVPPVGGVGSEPLVLSSPALAAELFAGVEVRL